nr:hypothetical protein [uncultured Desulfobacter sp.]
MNLNPQNVPLEVMPLLPMAEKWGIDDDIYRQEAINSATKEQLQEILSCLDDETVDDDFLFEWLAGPESFNPSPSDEYLALTALTMAYDAAKIRLKKMGYL